MNLRSGNSIKKPRSRQKVPKTDSAGMGECYQEKITAFEEGNLSEYQFLIRANKQMIWGSADHVLKQNLESVY